MVRSQYCFCTQKTGIRSTIKKSIKKIFNLAFLCSSIAFGWVPPSSTTLQKTFKEKFIKNKITLYLSFYPTNTDSFQLIENITFQNTTKSLNIQNNQQNILFSVMNQPVAPLEQFLYFSETIALEGLQRLLGESDKCLRHDNSLIAWSYFGIKNSIEVWINSANYKPIWIKNLSTRQGKVDIAIKSFYHPIHYVVYSNHQMIFEIEESRKELKKNTVYTDNFFKWYLEVFHSL